MDAAAATYTTLFSAGTDALLMAADHTLRRELSRRIRDDLLRLGLVSNGPGVTIADGTTASTGDLIVCPRNAWPSSPAPRTASTPTSPSPAAPRTTAPTSSPCRQARRPAPGPRPAPELARYDRLAAQAGGHGAAPSAEGSPEPDEQPDPLGVLAEILDRDSQALSASQTRRQALADADHLAVLNATWTAETTPARDQRYRDLLTDALPPGTC